MKSPRESNRTHRSVLCRNLVAASATACALLSCVAAGWAGPFAIRCSVPTTLSLQRSPNGVYRLTHSGEASAEITIEGIGKAGDVVYEIDDQGNPVRKVGATIVGDRLTFEAQPGKAYAIGSPDAVLAPTVKAVLEPDEMLVAGRKSRVRVEVRNYYDSALRGTVTLQAPAGLRVWPGGTRRLNVKSMEAQRVTFVVSKPKLTVEDVLGGDQELKITVEDRRGHKAESVLRLWVEDSPVRPGFVIEAEDISAEALEGQAITIRDDKVNMSGKAFSGWNDKGHWLEWRFNLPETGRYNLVFRFCVDGHVAHRDFMLDGKYPHEACRDIAFPDTGGWSNEKNDWRHHIVADADGRPIVVQVAAGEHTIRMTPIFGDGGCNLDYIALIPVNQ